MIIYRKFTVVVTINVLLSLRNKGFLQREVIMTKGKVKVSQTAKNVLPGNFKTETGKIISVQENVVSSVEVQNNKREIILKTRFARLKRALRKRSVSIL